MILFNKNKFGKRGIDKAEELKTQIFVTKSYAIVVTIICLALSILYIQKSNSFISDTNILVAEYEDTIEQIHETYETIYANYQYLETQYASMTHTLKELTDISIELDNENKRIVSDNEMYIEELSMFKEREELFNKYDYAIKDKMDNRTDITYEQLVKLENLLEDSNINDADIILAHVMVESNGNEKAKNPTSTAKGYGQILDGTSKFVYTKLMNKSDWYPDIALDGNTNLEMLVAYYDYLYEQNNGNLYGIIRNYSGQQDISNYVNKMDKVLSAKNKSVKQLSESYDS